MVNDNKIDQIEVSNAATDLMVDYVSEYSNLLVQQTKLLAYRQGADIAHKGLVQQARAILLTDSGRRSQDFIQKGRKPHCLGWG